MRNYLFLTIMLSSFFISSSVDEIVPCRASASATNKCNEHFDDSKYSKDLRENIISEEFKTLNQLLGNKNKFLTYTYNTIDFVFAPAIGIVKLPLAYTKFLKNKNLYNENILAFPHYVFKQGKYELIGNLLYAIGIVGSFYYISENRESFIKTHKDFFEHLQSKYSERNESRILFINAYHDEAGKKFGTHLYEEFFKPTYEESGQLKYLQVSDLDDLNNKIRAFKAKGITFSRIDIALHGIPGGLELGDEIIMDSNKLSEFSEIMEDYGLFNIHSCLVASDYVFAELGTNFLTDLGKNIFKTKGEVNASTYSLYWNDNEREEYLTYKEILSGKIKHREAPAYDVNFDYQKLNTVELLEIETISTLSALFSLWDKNQEDFRTISIVK